MTGPKGHPCPECGAPRGPDAPSCDCAQRAAEALLDTRTAEAAAAEDFDPLRIRPYVDLGAPADSTVPPRSPGTEGNPGTADTADTAPLRPVDPDRLEDPYEHLPGDLPEDRLGHLEASGAGTGGTRPRRRRTLLVTAGAALLAVLAVAGFTLFSYVTPSRNGAAPQEVREGVPDVTSSASAPTASASASSSGPASASSTPPLSTSPSSTASPSSSPASASPTLTGSASPAPTATRSGTAAPTATGPGPVLRPGDRGPEVIELQLRLGQLGLYVGNADGMYSSQVETSVRTYQWTRGIQADEPGVYDVPTRTKLESETSEP
ncbi:peptidoglycan-binding protein [Streptomyces sp. NPDC004542]|uniref:peptidoglycan-binding domain-containing protein n=1 Tax=Streptomyces sp. NPDC004542 TaxID=3154281 RepID=UPI0033B446B8